MDFFAQKTQLLACLRSCVATLAGEGGADAALAEVRAVVGDVAFHGGKPEEMRALLDHCLCQTVDDTLDAEGAAGEQLQRALDLTVLFAARGLVDLPCPLNVLNDVLGSQTIEECSATFAYLESKKAFLYEQGFFAEHKKKNAKVALLRLCNAMVKRLSKSNDTVFRGRILMFLATVLSISDRSGVGLRGQFNTDNVTEYDEDGAGEDKDGGAAAAAEGGGDSPVDMEFYRKFWGLQKLFVRRELIHMPAHWAELVEGVPLIFSAFASQGQIDDTEGGEDGGKKKDKSKKSKKDRGSKGASPRSSSGGAGSAATEPAAAAISNESYFAKFLTSRHLMSLELRDPHFRRHILVQVRADPPPSPRGCCLRPLRPCALCVLCCVPTRIPFAHSQLLIFFQHLQHLPSVGDPANKRLSPKQRSVIAGFVTKAEALLDKIAPKGHRFLKGAQHILDREEHWMAWKDRGDGAERCPTLSLRLFLKTTPASDKAVPKAYVDVEGGNQISELKLKVADKLGIPTAEQRLTVDKKELEDGKLICDYDLPSKSVVQVQRVEPQPEMPPMRKRRQMSSMGSQKRVKLGTEELTRLWNCGSTDLAGTPLRARKHSERPLTSAAEKIMTTCVLCVLCAVCVRAQWRVLLQN